MIVEDQLEKINQQLVMKGYKLTSQRRAIAKLLLDNEQDHLSAEDVYILVKNSHPEIGLATVYRTLELLSELNIVEKMNFGDGVARYDLRSDSHEHMHHHLICRDCGALEEIKDDWLTPLELRLEQEYGFKVTDHRLDFVGIYKTCKQKPCPKSRKPAS